MVLATLKRLTSGPKPVALMVILLLTALYLMSAATQNSVAFSEVYSLILGLNIAAVVILIALIARNLITLVHQYRQKIPGSRLTVRLVMVFVLLAIAPVSLVYYYALQFIHGGIDSWFDVRVQNALQDSLELGRTALDGRLRETLRQTRQYGRELGSVNPPTATLVLNDLRQLSEAAEMTLLTTSGKVIASSSGNATTIVPELPNSAVLRQVRLGVDYAALEPAQQRLQIRIAVSVPSENPIGEPRLLHAVYPIPERIGTLANNVQDAFAGYQELIYLRLPLKYSFTLTLSMVLLLSLLAAVWAAFFSARRLAAPISVLAEGTRAVSAGNYNMRLPQPGRDEMGFLVRSFNEMTRKIAQSRDEAAESQRQVEAQRAYLEAVLGRLSSGVLTIDTDGVVYTANSAAAQILGVSLDLLVGRPLDLLAKINPVLGPFVDGIQPRLDEEGEEWRSEVVVFGSGGRQVLMCRGSALPFATTRRGGHVVVFDDITALVQAQRDAAWGEVARRLAHEIKNPLTPIQLSAERLRHKYLDTMPPEEARILDSSTHTIVQQVEALKEMVKAFTDYARTPQLQLEPLDLNNLIYEVLDLYRGDARIHIRAQLDMRMPPLPADSGRLRQLLHNLLTNAREAVEERAVNVTVTTHHIVSRDQSFIELCVEDDGPGIPRTILGKLFDPYVTTKTRGTGLGLAIVKKIVEEHGGMLWAENRHDAGARITVRLPLTVPNDKLDVDPARADHDAE